MALIDVPDDSAGEDPLVTEPWWKRATVYQVYPRSFADAEDALQDTLINAYRYLHSYDSRWRFSTWLFRIAINNASRFKRILSEAGLYPPSLSLVK